MTLLSIKGQKYEDFADVLNDLIDDGYSAENVIVAINHITELESLDLGDEVRLFLDGMNYGKSLHIKEGTSK